MQETNIFEFSDNEITPLGSSYTFSMEKSQEALYDDLENWPTYYEHIWF